MRKFSVALGTLLKEWNRRSDHHANRPLSTHKLQLELLEDRRLLSVAGVATNDLVASLSLAAGSKATATVDVAQSVATSTSTGTMTVHLQPGAFSFDTQPNGEVTLSSVGLETDGAVGSPELPAMLVQIAVPINTNMDSVKLAVTSETVGAIPGTYHLTAVAAAATDTAAGTVIDTGGVQLVDGREPVGLQHECLLRPGKQQTDRRAADGTLEDCRSILQPV